MINQRTIARDVLARDAIHAATKVIEASPTYAIVGWDDHYNLWWVECPACGTDKFYAESVDTVSCARVRHNQKQHGHCVPVSARR